jgi:hypothetical protein
VPPEQVYEVLHAPEPFAMTELAAFSCFSPKNKDVDVATNPKAANFFRNSLLDWSRRLFFELSLFIRMNFQQI